ncbi:MAG: hypothetical protein R3C53_08880 [Pirellulaceae bacterium]
MSPTTPFWGHLIVAKETTNVNISPTNDPQESARKSGNIVHAAVQGT